MICLDKGVVKNLTIGKDYQILGYNNGVHQDSGIKYSGVWVINDSGIRQLYSSRRFIEIDQWREIQLNKLIK